MTSVSSIPNRFPGTTPAKYTPPVHVVEGPFSGQYNATLGRNAADVYSISKALRRIAEANGDDQARHEQLLQLESELQARRRTENHD